MRGRLIMNAFTPCMATFCTNGFVLQVVKSRFYVVEISAVTEGIAVADM